MIGAGTGRRNAKFPADQALVTDQLVDARCTLWDSAEGRFSSHQGRIRSWSVSRLWFGTGSGLILFAVRAVDRLVDGPVAQWSDSVLPRFAAGHSELPPPWRGTGQGGGSSADSRTLGSTWTAAAEFGPARPIGCLLPARQPPGGEIFVSSKGDAQHRSALDWLEESRRVLASRMGVGILHFRLFGPDGGSVAISAGRKRPASRRRASGSGPQAAQVAGLEFGGVCRLIENFGRRRFVARAGLPASRQCRGSSQEVAGVAAWLGVFARAGG